MVRIINIYITVTKQLASHLYLIIGNSRLYLYAIQQTAIFSKFLELTLFLVIWGHVVGRRFLRLFINRNF